MGSLTNPISPPALAANARLNLQLADAAVQVGAVVGRGRDPGVGGVEAGEVLELDAEAVGFVEWPEHGRGALPAPTLVVGIDLAPDGTRAFRLAWGRSSGSGPLP